MNHTWEYPKLPEMSSAISHYNPISKTSSLRKGVLCYELQNSTKRIVIHVNENREVTRVVLLNKYETALPYSLHYFPIEIVIVSRLNSITSERLVGLLSDLGRQADLITINTLNIGAHVSNLLSISEHETLKPRYTVDVDANTGDWRWRTLSTLIPVPTIDPNIDIILESYQDRIGENGLGDIKIRINKLLNFESAEEKLEFLYNWEGESDSIRSKGSTSLEILGDWLPNELPSSKYNLTDIPKEILLEQLHKL